MILLTRRLRPAPVGRRSIYIKVMRRMSRLRVAESCWRADRSQIIHSEMVSRPAVTVAFARLGLCRIVLDSNSVSGKLSPFVAAPTWLEAARVLSGPLKEGS